MEAVLSRLQSLTPDELRVEYTRAGLKCGPITNTTRSIFEKKLARTLVNNQAGDYSRSEGDGGETDKQALVPPANLEVVREDAGSSSQTLEDDSNLASANLPSMFYGVLPPLDDPLFNDGSVNVYVDKQKAIKAVMKMKGARFKAFLSKQEAENFAKGLSDGGMSPSKLTADKLHLTSPEKSLNLETVNMEKPNEFRSPRTQDLTAKLRRAVEKGDEEAFKDLVWSNPRYLIGSGDNPTIVQEGCRYNVLHIAAKENQPAMTHLILETLQNPEFMHLMYPDDQEDVLLERINYIVDLYLNTPDKGSNETPLHFACKFGCPDVVNVLCSHPLVDKNCRNKYGQMPTSVICERKNKNKETKQKIQEYLEDRFFVPLLRATDNTLNPVIGVPWAPGSSGCGDLSLNHGSVEDPKNPLMTIRAIVGPLNSSKAEEFHKLWRTPPRDRAKYFHHILKSDPDRGAERVGRELANKMGFPWAEYWDFLDCFTDLSEEDGLSKLEEYLNKAVQEKKATFTSHTIGSNSTTIPDDLTISPKTSADLHCLSESNISGGLSKNSPVCNLLSKFEKTSLQQAAQDSGLGGLILSTTEDEGRVLDWTQSEGDDSGSEDYYSADEDVDDERQPEQILDLSSSPRGRSSSVSSRSSYKSTHSIPEDEEGIWENMFLAGDTPSKLDHEVLLAVSGMDLDQQRYPCITRWKGNVLSYPESERTRWSSSTVRNRTSETQTSTPRKLTSSWLMGSPGYLSIKSFSPARVGKAAHLANPSQQF